MDLANESVVHESAPPDSPIQFQFTGNSHEYFRIWIVNTLLTILTLGIYSAWAKVRKQRYFYSNTLLQDEPFDYLADPVKILKGRLLVLVIFAVYAFIAAANPILGILLTLLALAFFPWLMVMSLRFKLRNSAYRNIRFNFRGTPSQAAGVLIKAGLVTLITLGIGYPYFAYKRRDWVVSNSSYGTTPFTFSATAGNFFGIYIITGLLLTVGIFFAITVGFLFAFMGGIVATVLMPVYVGALYLAAFAYFYTAITNLVYSNCATERFKLNSNLKTGAMMGLYITNAIGIVVSLGLLIPWAAIRMARYRIEHLALLSDGDLESFIAGEQEQVSAAGEEIAEFFDIDVGL